MKWQKSIIEEISVESFNASWILVSQKLPEIEIQILLLNSVVGKMEHVI